MTIDYMTLRNLYLFFLAYLLLPLCSYYILSSKSICFLYMIYIICQWRQDLQLLFGEVLFLVQLVL